MGCGGGGQRERESPATLGSRAVHAGFPRKTFPWLTDKYAGTLLQKASPPAGIMQTNMTLEESISKTLLEPNSKSSLAKRDCRKGGKQCGIA